MLFGSAGFEADFCSAPEEVKRHCMWQRRMATCTSSKSSLRPALRRKRGVIWAGDPQFHVINSRANHVRCAPTLRFWTQGGYESMITPMMLPCFVEQNIAITSRHLYQVGWLERSD